MFLSGSGVLAECILLTLVGQRMAIRLMRLDGDDSRAQYIEVYLSVY